ncbi:MAG TPA: DNA repair protein RecN [Terriglobales bacterium]|nr:DNA repair protein RecN [Terriglobales bacterium]
MLVELRVENYALIEHVEVEFGRGLNLLTGETGAGKSILIDALALLLGEKASSDLVRHGSERATVSAVFEVEAAAVAGVLDANGIDATAGEIIVRREIAASGKGRAFVNNQPATLAVLRLLAAHLATVHAQNESILAFDAGERLRLLDSFASIDSTAVSEAFRRWKSLHERIAELDRNEQDRLRLVDLWSFQKKEIESAKLEPGEDRRLEAEKRLLADAEKVRAAAWHAYELLYEGEGSAAASLRAAARRVEELAGYDEGTFREDLAALESARIAAEDSGVKLRDFAERIQASPARLAEVEDRLALLDRLKRKYGDTVDAVIAFGADVARKLDEVENRDDLLRRLRQQLGEAARAYQGAAEKISGMRTEAARRLEKQVEAELNELAMKARFQVALQPHAEEAHWTAGGFDQVDYLFAANPGEPLGPVERIASGGELSRVMLALKATVETSREPGSKKATTRNRELEIAHRTLIFDEIDTGIGGRAAEAVGRKLKALARGNQVLCITHLPQIAAFADHHYVVEKLEAGGRTRTHIRRLSEAERTEELARMLSGARLTETSRRHAQQLLKANP